MKSQDFAGMPVKSLSRSLTRRVLLLSLIGALGLAGTISLGFLVKLNQVQTRMDRINVEATTVFDRFFLDIQSDLKATSDGLATRKDKDSDLLALRTRNRALLDVMFISPDAGIVAQRNAPGRQKQTGIKKLEWLKSPIPFGQVVVGPVHFEGNTPYVDMAITATDDLSLPAGVLLVRVDLTELWNTMLDIRVGDTGYVYITDSAGQLVAYRNRHMLETGNTLKKLIGRTPQAIAASRLSFYKGMDSRLVLASAQKLQTVPCFAVVEQPVREAIAPFIIPVLVLMIALGIVVLLLYDTIRFTQSRIVSPLLVMRTAVRQMADGQLKQHVEGGHDDELGQLAYSFNRMASQLQQAFFELESKIDSLQQAKNALQLSESRIQTISNNLTGGMIYQVVVDKKGFKKFTYLSESVRQLYGVSPEEAIADANLIYNRMHADDIETFITTESEAIRTFSTFKIEVRINDPSGEIRWSSLISIPKLMADGSTCWDGIEFIITERKRTEEELRKLSQAVEQSPASIVITDRRGDIEYVNPAFCKITGYTAEYVHGKNPSILKSGKGSAQAYRNLWETITSGNTWQGEFCNRTKNGDLFWESACIAPIKDNKGAINHFVAIKEDITERKRAEGEKAQLEEQLQQAQKMESVGRLAGGVAHDFNNMLTVILGHANLALLETDLSQPLHVSLEEIRKAAERSADLTRQLLTFARKQTIAPLVLDLNEAVAGMFKMMKQLIGESIHVTWHPGADLWPVKVDPSQIDQILANLCVNARDAISDVGNITIETGNSTIDQGFCATRLDVSPGEYLLLAVSDDGCGMDKGTLDHIFEPFFTTKGLGEGTGLGLSTVYGVVKQNYGFIEVLSEPGQGTTFRIYLPRHAGDAELARPAEAKEQTPKGKETVLLVEDDLATLRLTTLMLERQGYSVLVANSPGDAVSLAEENTGEIHLLVTDVIMPKMNGRDLAIKLQSLYPPIKVLFMSGYTADIIAHHGVLDGGVYFIQKPFSLNSLATKVREVLDRTCL